MYSTNSKLLLTGSELIHDAPFFIPLGVLFGATQLVSYRFSEESNLGTVLLQEHIPFNTLAGMIVFLLVAKGLCEWLYPKKEMRLSRKLLSHIEGRAVAFASVAASVLFGFTIVVACAGAYFHSFVFFCFAAYLVSLAEIAANPLLGSGHSISYYPAIGIVVGLTFGIDNFI